MTLFDTKQTLASQNIQLVHVVAIDRKHCIGKDNGLAWHIPEDLKHFKEITAGGVVIMGRKTFESIGKPLPNRTNWVITRDMDWTVDGVKVAHSLEVALDMARTNSDNGKIFIIGGGEIYRQSIDLADVLEVTRVDLDIEGDAFYPTIPNDFTLTKSEAHISKNGISFCFESYERLA